MVLNRSLPSKKQHRYLDDEPALCPSISLCAIPNPRWNSLGTRTQHPSPESMFGQHHVDVLRPSFLPQQEAQLLGSGKNAQGRSCSNGPIMQPLHPVVIQDRQCRKKSLRKCLEPPELQIRKSCPQVGQIGPEITTPLTLTCFGSAGLSPKHWSRCRPGGSSGATTQEWAYPPMETLPLTVGQTLQMRRNVPGP